MKRLIVFCCLVLILSCLKTNRQQSGAFPRRTDVCVNDFAGVINAEDRKTIEQLSTELANGEIATVVVCTVDSIPKEKKYENAMLYATALFNKWGIGRKGIDDGLLFFISRNDGKVALCTGYSTARILPDSSAGRILRKILIPLFRESQYGRGIIEGLTAARSVMEKNLRSMYPEKYSNPVK